MKVKELHCSGKHQNYWVRGHGGRSVRATRFPDFSGNNGSWPVEAWRGHQSSETCWTKLPLQAVGRQGQSTLLLIS